MSKIMDDHYPCRRYCYEPRRCRRLKDFECDSKSLVAECPANKIIVINKDIESSVISAVNLIEIKFLGS